jgi:hypothetical protein
MKQAPLQRDKEIDGDLLRTLTFEIPLLLISGSKVRILVRPPIKSNSYVERLRAARVAVVPVALVMNFETGVLALRPLDLDAIQPGTGGVEFIDRERPGMRLTA